MTASNSNPDNKQLRGYLDNLRAERDGKGSEISKQYKLQMEIEKKIIPKKLSS